MSVAHVRHRSSVMISLVAVGSIVLGAGHSGAYQNPSTKRLSVADVGFRVEATQAIAWSARCCEGE